MALERQADIWLRLESSHWNGLDIPARVLGSYLNTLQTGIFNVATALTFHMQTDDNQHRIVEDLRRACDLQIMALQPGSSQVGLRLPILEELTSEYDSMYWQEVVSTAQKAVEELIAAAARLAGNSLKLAQEPQEETPVRRLALETLHQLLCAEVSEIQTLEIAGRHCPFGQPIRLMAQPTTSLEGFAETLLQGQVANRR